MVTLIIPYIKWLSNALPEAFYERFEICELTMNYLVEVRIGNFIDIRVKENKDKWLFETVRKEDDAPMFRAEVIGKPKV